MRILHLSDRCSSRGGADWHLRGVITELVARGHDVTLAVGRDEGGQPWPCKVVIVKGLDQPGVQAQLVASLDALAHRCRPDIIHIHNALSPTALGWAADHGAIATVQDHRSFCPGRGKLTQAGAVCREPLSRQECAKCFDDEAYFSRIYEVTEQRLQALRQMAATTVLSRFMAAELQGAGVEASEVIPPFVHGIDPDAPASGIACVLFAGRLVTAKGVDDALAAWQQAAVPLPLVLAGTGSQRQRLESLPKVEVLGWVDHQAMSGLYRRARVLVMPSRWQEPFGIVGLEALSSGVPVAAWESGGVAEWHPGGELLVPWGDVDALAKAISCALDTPASMPSGFDKNVLMDRLEAQYRLVTSKR